MPLFHLPVEIVELVFDEIVISHNFVRVMRTRLVNSQFKRFIDSSIFRLGILCDQLNTNDYSLQLGMCSPRESLPYIHSYVMYRVLREQPTAATCLGRIRHAGQVLGGSDDDLECLSSLVSLALACNKRATVVNAYSALGDTGVDVFVAAAYLGRKDYVSSKLITKNIASGGRFSLKSIHSKVFGSPLRAATVQGNLEMIKLLLSHDSPGNILGTNSASLLHGNSSHKERGNTCDHEPVFNFIFDMMLRSRAHFGDRPPFVWALGDALSHAATPKSFERALALLPPSLGSSTEKLQAALLRSVKNGKIMMVGHLLNKGVSPNLDDTYPTPLMEAIRNGDDLIFKMLLDFGADPAPQTMLLNRGPGSAQQMNSPLMTAVWLGRLAMAKTLLDRGVDPNDGYPAPIVLALYKERLDIFRLLKDHGARLDKLETGTFAMLIAERHGLSSMQDVLFREGVSSEHDVSLEDILLHKGLNPEYDLSMQEASFYDNLL
ncbi:ankyrin repeat-containing domain protein [Xylaria bambusicola]|uniref:ankyrin repeat-containing domain protein n=1 Tax=Xylaria bambusicola TaxID=326684 RepID=UPI002007EACF|nr:ankyrin repeat-containing domain protein [Xylaria bambusicola]KAI0505855.1 ankyrin repeat-containing domain protein [Xylaria bambusicola]